MRLGLFHGSVVVVIACIIFHFASFVHNPLLKYEGEAVRRGELGDDGPRLEHDFYRKSCPQAEKIVQAVVRDMYKFRASVALDLIKLLLHDCFIEGCDASVLLDPVEGMASERDSPQNVGLKGFDVIDAIKSQLELACPGIVSCADIVALAAREGMLLDGGPFYPLFTGRRDGLLAYQDKATQELPSPVASRAQTLAAFASRGFNELETLTLTFMTQQFMAGEHSVTWVRAYALFPSVFRKEVALAMRSSLILES